MEVEGMDIVPITCSSCGHEDEYEVEVTVECEPEPWGAC